MAINVKDVGDMFSKDVFTSKGYYAGKVVDVEFDLSRFKIRSIVIEASRDSLLGRMVGGKKGIVIPYPAVQAIGDIVLITHKIVGGMPEVSEMSEEEMVEAGKV